MTHWLAILGAVYLALLVYAMIDARRRTRNTDDYVLAGSKVGVALGFLTFSATLFSTFTLMGIPDFFRTHGVGTWIFLGVSDAALPFVVIWFGSHLRRRVAQTGFAGAAGLMRTCYGTHWASGVYLAGIFLFLIPYVSVQIRGISIFLNSAFPDALPVWGWATGIVLVMLIYSEIGGLKAIIYSDAIRGVMLLAVTSFIAYGCVSHFGGIAAMFEQVRAVDASLLSTPGPEGLFTRRYLIASFCFILLLPVTQPQLTNRIVIMRDMNAMRRMAVALGVFSVFLVLATAAIGMYGAVEYSDASTADFLAHALITDQAPFVAAAVAVGLIAAAMSTADSQIFALGTELRSVLSGEEKAVMRRTKLAIMCFALAALALAIVSSDQLVLLARVSFAGTALLGPFIIVAVLTPERAGAEVIAATGIGIAAFLASLMGWLPDSLGPLPTDLSLLAMLAVFALASVGLRTLRLERGGGPSDLARS